MPDIVADAPQVIPSTDAKPPENPNVPLTPVIALPNDPNDTNNLIKIGQQGETTVNQPALDAARVIAKEQGSESLLTPTSPIDPQRPLGELSPQTTMAAEQAKVDALAELNKTREQLQTAVKTELPPEEKFGLGRTVDAKQWNAQMASNSNTGLAPVSETLGNTVAPSENKSGLWSKLKKLIPVGLVAGARMGPGAVGMDIGPTQQDILNTVNTQPTPHVEVMPQGAPSIDAAKQILGQADPVKIDDPGSQNPHIPTVDSTSGGSVTITPDMGGKPDITPTDKVPNEDIPNEPKLDSGGPDVGQPQPDEPNGKPDKPGDPSQLVDMAPGLPGSISVTPGEVGDKAPSTVGQSNSNVDSTPTPVVPTTMPGTGGGFGATDIAGSYNPVLDNDKIAEIKAKATNAGQAITSVLPTDESQK